MLSRFEDFDYPDRAYEFVNAEFSLPFISAAAFPSVFTKPMASVKIGGLFTGQLFGPNDSWNLPESGMNFHSRSDVEGVGMHIGHVAMPVFAALIKAADRRA